MTIATPVPKQLVSILKKKSRSGKQSSNKDVGQATKGTSELLSSSQSQTQMSQSAYASFNKGSKALPPAPPKRDPSTTLSISRTRARSLVVPSEVRSAHNQTIMLIGEPSNSDIKYDNEEEAKCSSPSSVESMARHQGPSPSQNGNKVASIRSHSSRRISSYELNDFMSRQNEGVKSSKVVYIWFHYIF